MQSSLRIITFFLCAIVLFSCKKDTPNGSDPGNQKPTGVVTPVGEPDGTPAVTKTIGAQGGNIASGDGRISVTIPAGALTEDQQFSVESISNFNPLGIGQAYRLEPHGVEFKKPITVRFDYEEEDILNTIPEALGIAYQDTVGIWQARAGATVDKQNKIVTVTTTHFSDWSLFHSFFFYCSHQTLPVKKTAELEVFTSADLIEELVKTEDVPIGNKVSMTASYIKEWKLAGAGTLKPNANKATYTAPAQVPASPNPVAVSVQLDLKQLGKFLLVKNITIIDESGTIEVRAAGGSWRLKYATPAVKAPNGYYMIADGDGDNEGSYVLIMWKGEEGSYGYKSPYENVGNYVHYIITGGNNYTCMYMTEEGNLLPSGGSINITDMDDDGYIVGAFSANPAGYGEGLLLTSNIEGKFRVKRGF